MKILSESSQTSRAVSFTLNLISWWDYCLWSDDEKESTCHGLY